MEILVSEVTVILSHLPVVIYLFASDHPLPSSNRQTESKLSILQKDQRELNYSDI